MKDFNLSIKTTEELNNQELLDIMRERVRVFVLEQECAYQEIDEKDDKAVHIFLKNSEEKLAAYTRVIQANEEDYISFGRVLVNKEFRGQSLGREIVKETIDYIRKEYPNKKIKIGAQEYLREFYRSFGFKEISDVYLEDDIPHVVMLLVI